MTPNGAAVFAILIVGTAVAAGGRGLALLYAVGILFAAVEVGGPAAAAFRRAAMLMLPLAAFMILVWVVVVGRSPDEISSGLPGTRAAALQYVAIVCARLFLIIAVLQLAVLRFNAATPLDAVRALRVPIGIKRQLILTLSLIETLRHAIDRSHMALVAAGIVTRRFSLRNLTNGWVLAQTVWLTAITSVSGRMRDKWPVEHTLDLLAPALQPDAGAGWSRNDLTWSLLAAGAAAVVLLAGFNGTP